MLGTILMWIVACAAPTPLRRNLNPSSPLSPWPSGRATSEIPSASATSQPFKVKGERGSGAPFSRFTETRFYAAADRAAEHRSGPGPRATDGQADSGSHGGGTCAAAATPVGKVAKKKDRKIRTRTTDSGSSSSSLSLSPPSLPLFSHSTLFSMEFWRLLYFSTVAAVVNETIAMLGNTAPSLCLKCNARSIQCAHALTT